MTDFAVWYLYYQTAVHCVRRERDRITMRLNHHAKGPLHSQERGSHVVTVHVAWHDGSMA